MILILCSILIFTTRRFLLSLTLLVVLVFFLLVQSLGMCASRVSCIRYPLSFFFLLVSGSAWLVIVALP